MMDGGGLRNALDYRTGMFPNSEGAEEAARFIITLRATESGDRCGLAYGHGESE